MRVLGIESSCDETAAAVVTPDGHVLSDVIASQTKIHAPYGGVVPEVASRAHMQNVARVVEEALRVLPRGINDIDGIAVTQGPGLVGALLVGLQVAKAIAWRRGLPLVGVSHLEGHLLAVHLFRGDGPAPDVPFPYVALLVSGGHTALYRVDAPDAVFLLAQTRDDAAGEAFDKVGKLLGLGYPGGPVIDRLAADGDPTRFALPMPLPQHDSLEFSFSGVKTAVAHLVRQLGATLGDPERRDLAASFQSVMVRSLVRKSLRACAQEGIPRLVMTGGVAANRGLRAAAEADAVREGVVLHVPPPVACTDNAAMIAYAGALRLQRGERGDVEMGPFSRDPGFRRGRIAAT